MKLAEQTEQQMENVPRGVTFQSDSAASPADSPGSLFPLARYTCAARRGWTHRRAS
jgi:hypothetical protein